MFESDDNYKWWFIAAVVLIAISAVSFSDARIGLVNHYYPAAYALHGNPNSPAVNGVEAIQRGHNALMVGVGLVVVAIVFFLFGVLDWRKQR